MDNSIDINSSIANKLTKAIESNSRVSGHTHNFYRYPARFSPEFAKTMISSFTKRGDLVIDPFIGGGTTAVEARALGRSIIGIDINSLATFISKSKTTLLDQNDIKNIDKWLHSIIKKLNLHRNKAQFNYDYIDYYKNINCKQTWPIKKTIQLCIDNIESLPSNNQRRFTRCALLNTAQWALDSKTRIPSASEFRVRFINNTKLMLESINKYSLVVKNADKDWSLNGLRRLKIINRSTDGIENDNSILEYPSPKLILTSPPYPGVHVLYHRWQVKGRRETPAPYWIANTLDGSGESYYTFGGRKENDLSTYYLNTYKIFKSLSYLSNEETHIIQLIAFSEPSWQLPLYLETLSDAGFKECKLNGISNNKDGRYWRIVPNRKWYANQKGATSSCKEVILIHKLK